EVRLRDVGGELQLAGFDVVAGIVPLDDRFLQPLLAIEVVEDRQRDERAQRFRGISELEIVARANGFAIQRVPARAATAAWRQSGAGTDRILLAAEGIVLHEAGAVPLDEEFRV